MTTIFNIRPVTPNIGNDVIAVGLEGFLRSAFRQVNLVETPAAPGNAGIKGSGLSARNVYEINQLADGVVIGPGNLFENGALHVDVDALRALSVPLMLFSVSLGRIYDRTGKFTARTDSLSRNKIEALCRATDPIMVRDRATHAHLEALGVERVRIAGCPALFLDPATLRLPSRDPAIAGSVLLSVRHPRLMSIPYSLQGRLYQDVRQMVDLLRRQGEERVLLLCHDYQDLSFARSFPDVPALYTEDPYRFLAWLRDCRLNVTLRLHGFLSCLALGTPSIHLSYDERAVSMIETIGLAPWDVSLIHARNPLEELHERCETLPRLEELKRQARPIWDTLRTLMTKGVQEFAAKVEARKREQVF